MMITLNIGETTLLFFIKGVLRDNINSIYVHKYLDNQDCKAVRIFTMDISKAFYSVNHSLLSAELKQLPLSPYTINWYRSFLHERQQHVSFGNHVCTWKVVNKGKTHGGVSGPCFREYEQICNIPQCNSLSLIGVSQQSNSKFNEHVRQKLVKANRCLHVIRSLRKRQYSQVI